MENELIPIAVGSGLNEKYLGIWWFNLLANKSMLGLHLSIFKACFKMLGFSIHSQSMCNSLDSVSAVTFYFPGMWAAVMKDLHCRAHSHISTAILWHSIDLDEPILFIQDIAVVLSLMDMGIWVCELFMKDWSPNDMAFQFKNINVTLFTFNSSPHSTY